MVKTKHTFEEGKTKDVARVLSLNACMLPFGVSNVGCRNDRKKERAKCLIEQSQDYDVLLLQEVWDAFYSSFISDFMIEYAKQFGFLYSRKGSRGFLQFCNSGLLVISKYKIENSLEYTFSSSSGLQWFIPHGVMFVKIKDENIKTTLNLFHTHLHSGPLDSAVLNSADVAKSVQFRQAQELKQFIDIVMKPNEDYLVSGDFNVDGKPCKHQNAGACHRRECVRKEQTLDYDTFKSILLLGDSLCEQNKFATTYPLLPNSLVNPAFDSSRCCIDHVFATQHLKSISRCRVNYLKTQKYFLSDHAALDVEIRL